MLGSHDSFTFAQPKNRLWNLISWTWRTQNLDINKQMELGVQYFDVRVRKDRGKWRICHGKVDFNITYESLRDIVDLFSGYKLRLILERGTLWDEEDFKFWVRYLSQNSETISFAAIKDGWEVIIDKDIPTIDYCYVPWSSGQTLRYNIKKFTLSTIKQWAKKHNPRFTYLISKDKSTLYFMDYVGME